MKKLFDSKTIDKINRIEVDLPKDDFEVLFAKMSSAKRTFIIPLWGYYVAASISIVLVVGSLLGYIYNMPNHQTQIVAKSISMPISLLDTSDKIIAQRQVSKSMIKANNKQDDFVVSQKTYNHSNIFKPNANILQDRSQNDSRIDDDATNNVVSEKSVVVQRFDTVQRSLDEYANSFSSKKSSKEVRDKGRKQRRKLKERNSFVKRYYASANTSLSSSIFTAKQKPDMLNTLNGMSLAMSPYDIKTRHFIPISMGASVGIPLYKRISLNVGVQYTYLLSKTVANQNGANLLAYVVENNMHYIGIPVGVSYSLLSNDRFNIYTIIGATVEKGLTMSRVQYNYNKDGSMIDGMVYSDEKIRGYQLSINGGAGASLRLIKGLNMFVEPTFNWYIPNKICPQPDSKRVATPFTISLMGGIRWCFGR